MTYNSFMPTYPQYGTVGAPSYTSYSPTPPTQAATAYGQGQQSAPGIIWVDGEVGAKAYQIPAGWPANTPLPLWDTNDTVIYLKSFNPVGMPNPLQKIHYRMEEQASGMSCAAGPMQAALPSGEREPSPTYVTRDELDRLKEELREAISDGIKDRDQQTYTTKGGRSNESAV